MLLLASLSAIIIPFVLVVLMRMPARRAMPIATLSVALVAVTVWGMDNYALLASALQGIHRALMILWILLGAVFFMYAMQQTGAVERIKQGFIKISADMRVQAVIVGFAFIAMIEGVSGFGTPSAIGAPLLVALGFHPMSAVVLALVGDSVPTSFGAVATPLLVGLENVPDANIQTVGGYVTIIDALFGILLPFLLVGLLVSLFGRKSQRLKDWREMAPWALSVGLVYVIMSMITVRTVGVELTAILSGAVALIYAVLTAHYNILTPKTIWREHAREKAPVITQKQSASSLMLAWLPYFFVIIILLLQRTVPGIRQLFSEVLDLSWYFILGFEQISSVWQLLMSPGSVLLVAGVSALLLYRASLQDVKVSSQNALQTVLISAMALLPTLIMVQIFVNSGINSNGLGSMPTYIAQALAISLGPIWLAVAPFIGAITSFIVGSSTVSTLTMSPVQASVASQVGIPLDVAMAQQISGANAGNIIAIHNVVAASAVVKLHHQEGKIIRHTIGLVGVYLVFSVIGAAILLTLL